MAAKTSKAPVDYNQDHDQKLKALDVALTQIEKNFGKGSIMKLGESAANLNIETVPTGSLSLDIALGAGGYPKGRIIEIYGPESSGKTTLALHAVAEVQKRGGIAGFIDAEHALDPKYAQNIGVDIDKLYISSRIPVSRHWRSPRRWCAPARSTFWSSTRSQLSFRRRRSMVRWATATSVCRLDLCRRRFVS